MQKRLYRSKKNRMLAGVCGGLAEYFNIDPTIVRLIFVLAVFLDGFGILAYIILAIVVPSESSRAVEPGAAIKENVEEIKDTAGRVGEDIRSTFSSGNQVVKSPGSSWSGLSVLGLLLIVFGLLFLASSFLNMFNWLNWAVLWPLILVAIGVLIIVSGTRRK